MISMVAEQITDEEINEFMGNLGKSLKKNKEENQSEGEKLKDKIDQEKPFKNFPWQDKNKQTQV